MNLPFLGSVDLLAPWHLLWVVLGILLLFLARGGFIRLGGGAKFPRPDLSTRLRTLAFQVLITTAFLFACLGLAELGGGYHMIHTSEEVVARIVVTQDQSGSMYGPGSTDPLGCVFQRDEELIARNAQYDLSGDAPPVTGDAIKDAELAYAWAKQKSIEQLPYNPRIQGSCTALGSLIDALEERAGRKVNPVRHEIAFFRFATTSALQEPFTTDYAHFRDVLSKHDWHKANRDVGGSTNLHYAFYDMFIAALRRHMEGDEHFEQIPGEVLNAVLDTALAKPGDDGEMDRVVAANPELFRKLGEQLADTSLIMITDATEGATMWNAAPSIKKMLRLANVLHMQVYVISTEEDDPVFRAAVQATGTKDRPGDFFVLNKLQGYSSMKDVMQQILDRALARKRDTLTPHRKSYAPLCALIALLATCLAFVLKNGPLGRTLTG